MNKELDKESWWILNAVVEYMEPIERLAAPRDLLELHFNRNGHGLNLEQLCVVLQELFSLGYLTMEEDGRSLDCYTAEMIEMALLGKRSLFYGLTANGGLTWENYAKPDWNCYVKYECQNDPDIGEVSSSNKSLCEQYLEALNDPVITERTLLEVRPWQATYWKTLPHGFVIKFSHQGQKEEWRGPSVSGPDWYVDHFDSVCEQLCYEQLNNCKKNNNHEGAAACLLELGKFFYRRQNYTRAEETLRQAAFLFSEIHSSRLEEAKILLEKLGRGSSSFDRYWIKLGCLDRATDTL